MSLWIHTRKKRTDSRSTFIVPFDIMHIVLPLGICIGFLAHRPADVAIPLVLACTGFVLFWLPKAKLISERKLVTFGLHHLHGPWLLSYIAGYMLMLVGSVLILSSNVIF